MEGHFSCAHKDGFRVVTGSCLSPELPDVLRQLAMAMDEAQIQVVRALTSQYMRLEEVRAAEIILSIFLKDALITKLVILL